LFIPPRQRPVILEPYSNGTVAADQIGDFIDAWCDSGDDEKRLLVPYRGITEDKYTQRITRAFLMAGP